jgi:hypothetical protein
MSEQEKEFHHADEMHGGGGDMSEQEQEFHHADEMHGGGGDMSEQEQESHHADGGGGDAKRARQQRVQVVSESIDDNGECTQTVVRGDVLSYRKLGHTPGGINKTMIEYCRFCIAGESCQNCVKVNGQNVSNARAKAKKIQHPDLHELQLAKRREQYAENVVVSL